MKKIAFCFLIYDEIINENIWYNYFKNADIDKYNIYIHYKINKPLNYFEKYKLNNCIETKYASISLVKAQNILLEAGLNDIENTHFIFISGSCIPFKSFNEIYNNLDNSKSYFTVYPKIDSYPRVVPLLFYINYRYIRKASQWCILNRKHSELMLTNTKYLTWYNYVYASDEHAYITNIFCNNLQDEIVQSRRELEQTTFVNWSHTDRYKYKYIELYRNKHNTLLEYVLNFAYTFINVLCWCFYVKSSTPHEYNYITKDEITTLLQSKCYFARKFNKECNNILINDLKYMKMITYS